MSQHHYACMWQARPITIMLGWNRAAHGFFMDVEYDDQDDGIDEGSVLYDNLHDPALTATRGLSGDVGYFLGILAHLGLSLPRRMVDAVLADADRNAGNGESWYDHKGNVVASVPDAQEVHP